MGGGRGGYYNGQGAGISRGPVGFQSSPPEPAGSLQSLCHKHGGGGGGGLFPSVEEC